MTDSNADGKEPTNVVSLADRKAKPKAPDATPTEQPDPSFGDVLAAAKAKADAAAKAQAEQRARDNDAVLRSHRIAKGRPTPRSKK